MAFWVDISGEFLLFGMKAVVHCVVCVEVIMLQSNKPEWLNVTPGGFAAYG
jgi:hypothetical protein